MVIRCFIFIFFYPLTPSLSPAGEREGVRGSFEIGIWSLFGIWNL